MTQIISTSGQKSIYRICDDILAVREALIDNGGELTPELEEALTLNEEQLTTKADSLNGALRYCENYSKEIAEEIGRLQALKKAADNSTKRLKDMIIFNMTRIEKKEIDGRFCKFYLKKNNPSLIVDESTLMMPYEMVVKTLRDNLPPYVTVDVKIDKTAIKKQFKGTEVLPAGCSYAEPTVSLVMNKKETKNEEENGLSE